MCDYVRSIRAVASCRPAFLGLSNRLGLAPLRSHPVASTRHYARCAPGRRVSSPASFIPLRTRPLHARCIHGCISRESSASAACLLDSFSHFFFFCWNMKAPLAFFVPLVPVVRAAFNSRVRFRVASGKTDGRTDRRRNIGEARLYVTILVSFGN